MKRRNAECGKLRRPLKRSKISESIYGSTFLYLKFLLVWVLVLLADFILEFRFEYLWPFWLLLRSVYDSFKYQGLAFSVFFVCIAITSDMICFLFIPVHWLFFAASTYVWVQYVWHTERGVCLPTVSLWLLFVYIEASVRLRELKNLPIHLDLCRPFAAHCIGYPMVTLGFGFKSYIGYRMRQRKQKEVAKENDFYMQLLLQALPPEQQSITCNSGNEKTKALPSKSSEEIISNGVIHHKKSSHNSSLSNKFLDLDTKDTKKLITNNNSSLDKNEYEYLENLSKHSSVNDFDEMDDKSYKANGMPRSSTKWSSGHLKDNMSLTSNSQTNLKRSKCSTANNISSNKDDFTSRLEADIKRLKADLQLSRQCEQDLRAQINSLLIREQSVKNELLQLQQDNDNLQSKLHNLVTAKQQDKQTINALDKKLQEERKYHALAKTQLANERKSKKEELAAASSRSDCTEICKVRRRELENDLKQVHHLLKMREDQIRQLERETQSLRHYEGSHPDTDVLISALSAMQDKNSHLENSLSAETRLKLDLFSALGEVKRQLEIAQNQISKKDQEIAELKTKIAEVMAVFPPTSYPATTMESGINPLYSPKFIASVNSEDKVTSSKLDPNASIYTPKGN